VKPRPAAKLRGLTVAVGYERLFITFHIVDEYKTTTSIISWQNDKPRSRMLKSSTATRSFAITRLHHQAPHFTHTITRKHPFSFIQ
jgi:hypothetical protein